MTNQPTPKKLPRVCKILYLLAAASAILYFVFTQSPAVADWFNRSVSRIGRQIFAYLFAWLPFSFAELLIILLPLEFKIGAAALWLLRLGWVLFEVKRIARRLGENRLLAYYPIYDLFSPYWTFILWCIMLRKDERVWR